MPLTEKWSALTSRGSQLTTEINSLASGAYTAASAAYDNTGNLDSWGIAELLVTFGSAPTLDSVCLLFGLASLDGTNYEDGSASLRPPDDAYLGSFQVYNNTSAQRLFTKPFKLKPVKYKFILYNGTNQAFPASGSTLGLYTFNRTIG